MITRRLHDWLILQTVMFATLSSFLPSALQQGSPNPGSATAKGVPTVLAEDTKPSGVVVGVDDVGVKRKERRINHEVRLCVTQYCLCPHYLYLVVHSCATSSRQIESSLESPGPACPSTIS